MGLFSKQQEPKEEIISLMKKLHEKLSKLETRSLDKIYATSPDSFKEGIRDIKISLAIKSNRKSISRLVHLIEHHKNVVQSFDSETRKKISEIVTISQLNSKL